MGKEEPLIPQPYRDVIKELRALRTELEEIKGKLPVAVPSLVLPKEEFREVYVEALKKYGALLLAEDLYVQTIDLAKDRSTSATIEELPKLKGMSLTIFSNTGTFHLYINEKDDEHKLTFPATMTYPQRVDWFEAKTFYIGNSAQSGEEAVLIAWKR